MTAKLLREIRAAATFLTRVPVGGFPYTDDEWRSSSAWFPVVGALIGIASALVWWIALPLGPAPAAFCVLGFSMLATGGFHEDGLADTADALGGGHTKERVLEILKDSRVGAFGAMALFVVLGLRVTLTAGLLERAAAAIVLAQCFSRAPIVWIAAKLPYVTSSEVSKSGAIARPNAQTARTAIITALGVSLVLVLGTSLRLGEVLFAIAACCAVAWICTQRFRVRIGGVTGDFLGTVQQLGEVAILAALLWGDRT